MRTFGGLVVAFALGTSALAGCSQGSGAVGAIDVDPKTIEAHVTKLAGETFKGTGTEAVNLDGLRAMLPPEVALTWGNLSFDAATNSTLITDLKLTPKDMPQVGVQIAELRLFDFDAKLLQDRLSGQRLEETAQLARRIDAKGVSTFGIAAAINQAQAAMMQNIYDTPTEVIPAEPANPLKFQPAEEPVLPPAADDEFGPDDEFVPEEMTYDFAQSMTIDRYDVSIGRLILDDVMLKPYQVVPAAAPPADVGMAEYDPMAQMMPVLQQVAAIAQSYGVDTAAYLDFKVGFGMTQFGQKVSGDATVKSMGARGMRGGDLDGMFIRDVSYKFEAPGADGAAPQGMEYNLALMTLEDMRFEKVMGFLAKGMFPPRTESNLMSLGIWRSEKESFKLSGKEIYSVGESMFDATGFHWFIPSNIKASGKDVKIDFAALVEFAQQMSASSASMYGEPDPEMAAASAAQVQQVLAALNKHGLAQPTLNYASGWNWNAGNGDTRVDFSLGGADLLQIDTKYEGAFPSFKAVSDLIPEKVELTDGQAVASLFESASALKLIDLNVKDNGGLEKIYGLIGDLAPAMGGPAMGAADLRVMASSGVKMMASSAASQIPELPALLNPVAAFLELGGKLHIAVQPTKPTPFATLSQTLMGVGMGATSPSQVIKDLGVKVEHSK